MALEDSLSTLLLLGLAHAQAEKQKLRLQQEQERLILETELAKPNPKEQVFFFNYGTCPAIVCAESSKLKIQGV